MTAASEADSWVYAKHITTTHSESEGQEVFGGPSIMICHDMRRLEGMSMSFICLDNLFLRDPHCSGTDVMKAG